LGDNKENIHTNQIILNAKNIFSAKIQTPSNCVNKLTAVVNTPSNKNSDENQTSEKKIVNSPLEHITPRTNILIDKNSRNKISMMSFGKCKMISKNHRNLMKPPKKNYTMNSNRNSSSDSSFSSFGQIGLKPAFQEQFTPNHPIRGSFDVKSTDEFLNNTLQNVIRNPESSCDNFNMNFNYTIDAPNNNIMEHCSKGNSIIKSLIY